MTFSPIDYALHYGSGCRDCADADGTCPTHGLPCNPKVFRAVVEHTLKAWTYGIEHGFMENPFSSPGKDGGQQEDLSDLPDQFETWWQTSRFNQEPCDRYSQRKQLAWDAYYAASIAPKAGKDGGQEVEAGRAAEFLSRYEALISDSKYRTANTLLKDEGVSIIRSLATQPASTALVERLTKALSAVNTWAEQRCPCRNEEPNPCPLCGADANKSGDICLSAENTFPRYLLTLIRAALSASTSREGER